jgi:hypothetical protein
MTTVTIEIDEQGGVKTSVTGAPGTSCYEATKALETALGTVTHDEPTPELRQRVLQSNRHVQTAGNRR